ncbi:hypothetical protein G6F56_012993 [Rhizopus delemar]|nr:hypothetical protein G6F56_012993 [Rhizopus delemar]
MARRQFLHRLSRLFKEDKFKPSEKIEIFDEPQLTTYNQPRLSNISVQHSVSDVSSCDTSSFVEPLKLGLADQVKTILGDAIDLADQELEQGY